MLISPDAVLGVCVTACAWQGCYRWESGKDGGRRMSDVPSATKTEWSQASSTVGPSDSPAQADFLVLILRLVAASVATRRHTMHFA